MRAILGGLRAFIALLQSALMLGGCASILLPSDSLFAFCVVWFLILCGVQLALVGLIAIFIRGET